MMNFKISVIIPVYNVEKYLEQSLGSVINQTLKEIEIICVNDGSTDSSKQILEAYAEKDKRVIIINQTNSGLGAARNKGIKYATGEYIGFVDADDWIDKTMFEKLYENAQYYNSDIVMCPICLVNDFNGELIQRPYFCLECFSKEFDNIVFDYKQTKHFIFDIAVTSYNKIYKTKFINNINAKFPEGLLFEDVPFFYKTYLSANKISLIRDFLYMYRINRDNSITAKADKRHFDIIKIQDMTVEIFSQLLDFEYFRIELFNKKILRIMNRYFDIDDIYKEEFFEVIKQCFVEMNLKEYDLEQLNVEMKKCYQNVLNSYSYREFELKEQVIELRNNINSLEKDLKNMKEQIEIIANTRPYRMAYALHRFCHEFFKGSNIDKKNFLVWIYCKLTKKENKNGLRYNPLIKIVGK